MKKLIKQAIFCGISGKMGRDSKYHFTVDFEKNDPENDAIQFIKPYFKASQLRGVNIYWFGYQFNGHLEKDYRDACIEYLKNVQVEPEINDENMYDDIVISDEGISNIDLYNMIERSMRGINLDNLSVDTIIYPESTTNNLVYQIVDSIKTYLRDSIRLTTLAVKKANPANITIDIDRCMSDISSGRLDDNDGMITKSYLTDLQNKIRNLDQFSLRNDIHPICLRRYVGNFIEFRDVNNALANADKVLIVDDFKTTGTTLSEIARIIRSYNNHCQIYVFTLLGNSRKALQ